MAIYTSANSPQVAILGADAIGGSPWTGGLEVSTMARIDAAIATQVAETQRPSHAALDSKAQAGEAQRQESAKAEPDAMGPATADALKVAAQRMQTVIETATGRQLDFTLNERFKELIVRISDRKSGEVIKEFPSKEFMMLRERLSDLIGLFINEKI